MTGASSDAQACTASRGQRTRVPVTCRCRDRLNAQKRGARQDGSERGLRADLCQSVPQPETSACIRAIASAKSGALSSTVRRSSNGPSGTARAGRCRSRLRFPARRRPVSRRRPGGKDHASLLHALRLRRARDSGPRPARASFRTSPLQIADDRLACDDAARA